MILSEKSATFRDASPMRIIARSLANSGLTFQALEGLASVQPSRRARGSSDGRPVSQASRKCFNAAAVARSGGCHGGHVMVDCSIMLRCGRLPGNRIVDLNQRRE